MAGPALVWLVLLPCFPASLLLLVITHGAGGIPLLQPQRNPVQFAPESPYHPVSALHGGNAVHIELLQQSPVGFPVHPLRFFPQWVGNTTAPAKPFADFVGSLKWFGTGGRACALVHQLVTVPASKRAQVVQHGNTLSTAGAYPPCALPPVVARCPADPHQLAISQPGADTHAFCPRWNVHLAHVDACAALGGSLAHCQNSKNPPKSLGYFVAYYALSPGVSVRNSALRKVVRAPRARTRVFAGKFVHFFPAFLYEVACVVPPCEVT